MRASRIEETVAASDSTQRSARTFCISGCSISSLPKAERWAAWWVACATAARIPAVEPIVQSRRVWLTISMIVGTPRPSSPTIRAQAPRNSTSLEALEWLPSLSLSRWISNRLSSPSGVQRGSRKQEMPESVWARTRKASHIGAEQNHLWPVISYSPPGPPPFSGAAEVVLARTSEPPCFSVIAIPQSAPVFSGGRDEAPVVGKGEKARLPLVRQLGLGSQGGDRRVGHRDRAADAALGLGELHEQRRPGDVGARAGLAPGQRVEAVGDPDRHQLVPGAVEDDLVDPMAEAVVGAQLGPLLVGLEAEADDPLGAAQLAQLANAALGPAGPLALQGLAQRAVLLEGVEALQRGWLVDHRMGGAGASVLDRGHGEILRPCRKAGL